MTSTTTIRRLDAAGAVAAIPQLAELLIDCVEGGASVSFMPPMTSTLSQELLSSARANLRVSSKTKAQSLRRRVEAGGALVVAPADGILILRKRDSRSRGVLTRSSFVVFLLCFEKTYFLSQFSFLLV